MVIGAGPAGLAAATTAARFGRSVALLDAATRPGGQFWRHRAADTGAGHRDWATFAALRDQLSGVDYRPGSRVWFVEPGFTVHLEGGERFAGARLVLATGAYDRSFPFPGWDLPGVVTAGAAQALLKGQGVPIGKRVVVAGSGPFLLPVAAGLARAGVRVPAVIEAASPLGYLRGVPPLGKVAEAAAYLAQLARHRIPYRTRRVVSAAHGDGRVTAVTVSGPGGQRVIECDALAIGYGFTPQVELAIAAGCETRLDGDGSLVVQVEDGQSTSVPGVYAAGEVTGVGGAELSLVEGRLAGLAATGQPLPLALLRRRSALRRFAAVLARVHRTPPWAGRCDEQTVLCRCEGVTVDAVNRSVRQLGVVDGRGAKLMTRVGMGWCQGRVCGAAACQLVAAGAGREVSRDDLLAFGTRPIAQPVTLAELAE
ncbi:oxidase [Rhizocola hellebori]|uniref:Oxidase n=1 Tax=Rhizocola hellebori TaxID=1392758 RepID=A0A8J3Q9W4_9ACTN|nr:oxidase [Rhizocola hellebori]